MPSPHRAVLAAVVAVVVGASASACLRTSPGSAASAGAGATTTTPGGPIPPGGATSPGGATGAAPGPGEWSDFQVQAAAWSSWAPVVRNVRPATEGDVDTVASRARAVLGREFTATAGAPFGEYTLTRGRLRSHVRFGPQERPVLDVYADQAALADPDPQRLMAVPLTVCPHAERSCFTLTGKDSPGDRPHLFDVLTDSLVYLAAGAMTAQTQGPAFLDAVRGQGVALATATVESPLGALDCVVVAQSAPDLDALEGTQIKPGNSTAGHAELCIDRRGLVVLAPGQLLSPVTPWTSLRTSTSHGQDAYPFPVRPYPS